MTRPDTRYVIESGDGQLLAETDSLFVTLRTLADDGEPFPVHITDARMPRRPLVARIDERGCVVIRS